MKCNFNTWTKHIHSKAYAIEMGRAIAQCITWFQKFDKRLTKPICKPKDYMSHEILSPSSQEKTVHRCRANDPIYLQPYASF